MIFDPFGDFARRGYLRNVLGLKDKAAVDKFEHRLFLRKLPEAVDALRIVKRVAYRDVLGTHKILFDRVYPWAGQDRAITAPDLRITKGRVEFAHPRDAQAAVEYALNLAQDRQAMATRPGEVIGYLAHGHPFLDGNGRTILIVVDELARRAGISLDWPNLEKIAYLNALTRELADPGQGKLDAYLAPFIRKAVDRDQGARILGNLRGLGPDGPSEP
ncbi:MAG: Fic family protein [Beijerinckiaceae bacterium]|nr:Fic family protein [Beijerinckiaceae bacterium]